MEEALTGAAAVTLIVATFALASGVIILVRALTGKLK